MTNGFPLRNPMAQTSFLKEAQFYEQKDGKKVQCLLCAHNCIIAEGKVGICSVRKNVGGKLYSLVYGKASSISADPVEKKPLYHFYPGSSVLSFGTVGCNLKCQYCQNWRISQVKPEDYDLRVMGTAEQILSQIRRYTCSGVAFTYNEPTIWYEFAYDICRVVKAKDYYTIFVSNGYINPEPLKKIAPYLDAINIDLKAISEEQYVKMSKARMQPVLDTLKLAHELGLHIELTTLVVPGFNDSPEDIKRIADWTLENLGSEIPVHLTRYHPDYHYDAPATPIQTLIRSFEVAKKAGLDYVYLGNIMKTDYENTRCSQCSNLLVKRRTKFIERLYKQENGKVSCPKCSNEIPIIDRRRKIISKR
jgi:pyruvate formate lyase activating enzyme